MFSAVGYIGKHELSDSLMEESSEVKLPTIWTNNRKAEVGSVREEKVPEERRCRCGKR